MSLINNRQAGFTLLEVVIASVLFLMIVLAISQAFSSVFNLVKLSRVKMAAALLASEEFEGLRQLAYQDVGLVGGVPTGKWPRTQTLVRGGRTFLATTTIRNIDDPFDGVIGGTPNDLSPADYKLAELTLWCDNCLLKTPLTYTATFAPQNLETTSGNGALFVRAINAVGQPVPQATVHVVNNQGTNSINIDEETNNDGWLQLVDVPPGNFTYEISLTKSGYSQVQTLPPGGVGNPEPTLPHATVAAGQATQLSLSIDRLSGINLETRWIDCSPLPSVNLHLRGTKTIGLNPLIYKYDQDLVTDEDGHKAVPDLEWDSYQLTATNNSYDLVGLGQSNPQALAPGVTLDWPLYFATSTPRTLLVDIRDSLTGLPLNGALAVLSQAGGGVEIPPLSYNPNCTPVGQSLFSGLAAGTYDLMVNRTGYQSYRNAALNINANWQSVTISLSPL